MESKYNKINNETILFSIITVVYNGQKHIEQTIKSVLSQKKINNIEYIIIDGNSTDSTLEIISKYLNDIDYLISEEDTGIYNAMNKGIDIAQGKYIGFINADDWYEKDVFDKLHNIANDNYDYIIGNVAIFNQNNTISNLMKLNIENYKRTMPFGHPALFTKKEIMQKYKFDEQYKIVADYDFCIKLILNNYSYKYVNFTISNFRLGGVSNTLNVTNEIYHIQKKNFGFFFAFYWLLVRTENKYILNILKIISFPLQLIRKIPKRYIKEHK